MDDCHLGYWLSNLTVGLDSDEGSYFVIFYFVEVYCIVFSRDDFNFEGCQGNGGAFR